MNRQKQSEPSEPGVDTGQKGNGVMDGYIDLKKCLDLSPELVEALRSQLRRRREEWFAKGETEIPKWVFCGQRGEPFQYSNFRRRDRPGFGLLEACFLRPAPGYQEQETDEPRLHLTLEENLGKPAALRAGEKVHPAGSMALPDELSIFRASE